MTCSEIITRVDLLEPNDYSTEQKLRWLEALDGKVFEEVISTHEDAEITELPSYPNGTETLIIGAPYGLDIYYYYLQAMIAAENSETQRYNRRMAMYNNSFTEWTNFYNRTHKAKKAGTHFLF